MGYKRQNAKRRRLRMEAGKRDEDFRTRQSEGNAANKSIELTNEATAIQEVTSPRATDCEQASRIGTSRTDIQILQSAVKNDWGGEVWPITLSSMDFDENLRRNGRLTATELAVVKVQQLLNSEDPVLIAIAIRLMLQMEAANDRKAILSRRQRTASTIPTNRQSEGFRSEDNAYQPIQRYQLRLPDNKRGLNQTAEQQRSVLSIPDNNRDPLKASGFLDSRECVNQG